LITSRTHLVGLLGYPIEHSVSPAMHNAAFAHLGLDWAYLPLPLLPDRLGEALRGLLALGFRGANLTIPHKEQALAYLDDITPEARALGAVNTITIEDYKLVGHNTDADGFLAALTEAGGQHQRAVVLGAGGAARAVVQALRKIGVSVTVANRTLERALRLSVDVCALDAPSLGAALKQADLLVNATPVGMWPAVEASPLPEGLTLSPDLTVFDLVYNPLETRLLQQARLSGAKTINGLGMLVYQGAAAFRLWTGIAPPLEVMRQAAMQNLRPRSHNQT
jgi:shikimate dehydrogenase